MQQPLFLIKDLAFPCPRHPLDFSGKPAEAPSFDIFHFLRRRKVFSGLAVVINLVGKAEFFTFFVGGMPYSYVQKDCAFLIGI